MSRISAWGFVGYDILYHIPVIGWLFLILFSFSRRNPVRRSHARSYWCRLILWIVLLAVALSALGAYLELRPSDVPQAFSDVARSSRVLFDMALNDGTIEPIPYAPQSDARVEVALDEGAISVHEDLKALLDRADTALRLLDPASTRRPGCLEWAVLRYADLFARLEGVDAAKLDPDDAAYALKFFSEKQTELERLRVYLTA